MFTLATILLAGGGATRMGGLDKGLQLYAGAPLVDYMVNLAKSLSTAILISANRNIECYERYVGQVVEDHQDFVGKGPLAGIATALTYVGTSHVLLLPCDTPNVSHKALETLIDNAKQSPSLVHYLETDSGQHPLHAVIPVGYKQMLFDHLKNTDRYSVMGFYRKVGCQACYYEGDAEFENINFTEQLR